MPSNPAAVSPFRLASLLRRTADPDAALRLFLNPVVSSSADTKPFRRSLLSYELIISKLCRARMFPEVESVLLRLRLDTRISPPESLFCRVISSYARARLPHLALRAFLSIPSFPNGPHRSIKSLNCVLHAFGNARLLETMLGLLDEHGEGLVPDVCTYNILIDSFCSRGSLVDARKVFDGMIVRGVAPNAVTFGTLINGLCAEGRLEEAFELKDDMGKVYGVKGNANAYVPLIKAACKAGDMGLAFHIKEEMVAGEVKLDSAVYATLISGLYRAGRDEEVRGVLEEMERIGCKMDTVCYNVMIQGRCKSGDFAGAFGILDDMILNGCKPDVISYNVIIMGLLREPGRLDEAKDLFEDMPRRGCKPDVVTHRLLFDALLGAARITEATELLDEMAFKGFAPRSASSHELVEHLCMDAEGNEEALARALCSLGKVKAVPLGTWARVVSRACKEDDPPGLLDLLQHPDQH